MNRSEAFAAARYVRQRCRHHSGDGHCTLATSGYSRAWHSPELGNTRDVQVYLPPSYAASSRHYPGHLHARRPEPVRRVDVVRRRVAGRRHLRANRRGKGSKRSWSRFPTWGSSGSTSTARSATRPAAAAGATPISTSSCGRSSRQWTRGSARASSARTPASWARRWAG